MQLRRHFNKVNCVYNVEQCCSDYKYFNFIESVATLRRGENAHEFAVGGLRPRDCPKGEFR
jgi:hypothetical protein